jgi:hypothetical protein
MTAVDYAWARPTIASLQAAGVTAVGRYIGPSGWGKTITQPEYDALVAAGIEVFLVFEQGADDGSTGYDNGVANGQLAAQWIPKGYTGPVFVACDSDIDPNVALPYVQGFSSVFGPGRTGVYGEGALIVLAHDSNAALVGGWQSASTSFPGNATTTPDTSIQQGFGGPVDGSDADTIVRPLIGVPVPTPSSPQSPGVMMIPSGCTDHGAFNAQVRFWWATFRTDPMTPGDQPFFWYFFNLPTNQTAWNVAGWGGDPDSVLTWIIDDASTKGLLRSQVAGSV